MAKIARKTQKIFAGGASNNGQFGSAQVGTKVLSNDPTILQSLSAFTTGWLSATISAENLPPLEEFQALDYLNTYQLSYLFQEGIPEWDSGTTYFINSIVKKSGTVQLYGSITDNNTGNALTDPTNWVLLIDLASAASGGVPTAVAGGTADAITATFSSISLVDRQLCVVRASGPNTVTNPTFSPNGLTAHTITKLGGQALAPADIAGANADIMLCYDLPNTRWELLNPTGTRGNWCVAGGAADVITGTYAPAIATLYDGLLLYFRATAANATTTPTYNANGTGAHVITKKGGGALAAGDIPNLGEMEIRYNLANTRWELYNPASTAAATVTSVALAMPALFSVSGSPVTSSGTLTAAFANQNANLVFAGPASGGAATPGMRSLVNTDLPSQGGITPGTYRYANVTVNQQGIITGIAQSSGSDFTSSNHAIVYNSGLTIAHGLGSAPSDVTLEIVCDTADNGWNAGDTIVMLGSMCNLGASTLQPRQLNVGFNSTNIFVTIGIDVDGQIKTTGGNFSLNLSNWHIRVRAWL